MKNFRIFFFFLSVFCICYLCTRIGSKRSKKQVWIVCMDVSSGVGVFASFPCRRRRVRVALRLFWRRLEKLFQRQYFFSAQFFLYALFPLLVYLWSSCGKIHLIFLSLSCVESLSLRSFRPLRPWECPHVRAKPSERSACV